LAANPSHLQLVINLCRLDAPITVPQPVAPRLTRYSFFLSRFGTEARRRYQLHMGYFHTQAEAEKWLGALKRVYPSARIAAAPEPELSTAVETPSGARYSPAFQESLQALGATELDDIGQDDASNDVSFELREEKWRPWRRLLARK
jgi:hypothetical protein